MAIDRAILDLAEQEFSGRGLAEQSLQLPLEGVGGAVVAGTVLQRLTANIGVSLQGADDPGLGLGLRAVFRCIACAAAFTPPTPPSQERESWRPLVFSPPCEGGVGGVLRVPMRCARFVIHTIENRSRDYRNAPQEALLSEASMDLRLSGQRPRPAEAVPSASGKRTATTSSFRSAPFSRANLARSRAVLKK